jgi:hypothetical protein
MIQQMTQAYNWDKARRSTLPPEALLPASSIGSGIGLACVIWLMQLLAAIFKAQASQRADIMGLSARAAVSPHRVLQYDQERTYLQITDIISKKSM